MNKMGKYITGIVIVITLFVTIYTNSKDEINDNIYVVSEANEIKDEDATEDIENDNNKEVSESLRSNEDTSTNNIVENINTSKGTKEEVCIYVSGEVKNPGVITIASGSRLDEAIELLGGVTENANLNGVNLAMKVQDEGHYIVPKIGEATLESSTTAPNNSLDTSSKKVNLNTASLEELDTLPGVGEATATKIINYRDEEGMFKSIEEIKNVSGIGDKKYEDIKELIAVN